MKRTFSFLKLLLFFISITLTANALNYPKTTQNGKEFYIYNIKEHEGLYSISKTFGISQEEIIQYNPFATNGVKKGMTLKIPTFPKKEKKLYKTDKSLNLQTITISKGQTLYSISKKYNTTTQKLMLYNPELKNGIKIGQEIKVPTIVNNKSSNKAPIKSIKQQKAKEKAIINKTNNFFIEHEVKPKETIYGIGRIYNVSPKEIAAANPQIEKEGLKIGQILQIPTKKTNIKSFTINQEKTIKPKENTTSTTDTQINNSTKKILVEKNKTTALDEISNKENLHNVRVALLLPLMLNDKQKRDATIDKFVEFYEGMLLNIKKLKEQGISVELNTYDTEKSVEEVNALLIKNPEIKKANLIIGPAYSSQIKPVSDFAKENHIPLVIPFSQNVTDLTSNPYVFEFNCPDNIKMSTATQLFINNFKNKNIIILHFNDDIKDEGSLFARNLESKLKRQNIKFHEIPFTPATFATIDKYLTKNKESIIVFATEEKELVQDFLPKLKNINTPSTPISIFGFYNWQNQLRTYPSTYYYTSFFDDNTNQSYVSYNEHFRSEFGNPTSSYPRFDLLGYDLSSYFISRIATSKPLSENENVKCLQSKLNFQKLKNGGYVNKGLFLIQYEGSAGFRVVE